MNIDRPEAQLVDKGPTVCFIALPFGDKEEFPYDSVLLPALREVLELGPYYWRVGRADDELYKNFIYDNIGEWLTRAHVYIADISDLNYNVMMEFGYMHWARESGKPVVVLERKDPNAPLPKDLADIQGLIRTPYTVDSSLLHDNRLEYAISQLKEHFKRVFWDNSEIQQIRKFPRQHYLSPLWIEEQCRFTNKAITDTLSKHYITMEAFKDATTGPTGKADTRKIKAAAKEFSSWGISEGIIENISKEVITVLR